jgi:hypothetical protein
MPFQQLRQALQEYWVASMRSYIDQLVLAQAAVLTDLLQASLCCLNSSSWSSSGRIAPAMIEAGGGSQENAGMAVLSVGRRSRVLS